MKVISQTIFHRLGGDKSAKVAGGQTVKVILLSNSGRSAEFLVDVTKYELKTITDVAKQDYSQHSNGCVWVVCRCYF